MRYSQDPEYDPQSYMGHGVAPRWTPAVKWLVILNVVLFVLVELLADTQGSLGRVGAYIFGYSALSPALVFQHGFVWQLVTYAFMHGGVMHILFNMLFLYWFGRPIEALWGAKRFLTFYLLAALFAGLLYCGLDLLVTHEGRGCIGASGAIMALLMVYAIYWPDHMILFMFIFPMRMRTFVLITIAIEFFYLMDVIHSYGVANIAHLGGLFFGFGWVYGAHALSQRQAARVSSAAAPNPADEHRLNEILDKVHLKGIQSLSWLERRFLNKMSRKK